MSSLYCVMYLIVYISNLISMCSDIIIIILSCASGVGSPTNHPGSGHRARDPLVRSQVDLVISTLNFLKRRTDRTLDPFY